MFCYATRVKADECQRGYVKVTTNLNVREDPALKSKVIAKLNPGDIVKIYKEKENFYYITALSDDKIKGYVSKDYVIIPEKEYWNRA